MRRVRKLLSGREVMSRRKAEVKEDTKKKVEAQDDSLTVAMNSE